MTHCFHLICLREKTKAFLSSDISNEKLASYFKSVEPRNERLARYVDFYTYKLKDKVRKLSRAAYITEKQTFHQLKILFMFLNALEQQQSSSSSPPQDEHLKHFRQMLVFVFKTKGMTAKVLKTESDTPLASRKKNSKENASGRKTTSIFADETVIKMVSDLNHCFKQICAMEKTKKILSTNISDKKLVAYFKSVQPGNERLGRYVDFYSKDLKLKAQLQSERPEVSKEETLKGTKWMFKMLEEGEQDPFSNGMMVNHHRDMIQYVFNIKRG